MADATLREKIRKRRQALQESLAQSDADPDISTSRMDDTWASNDVEPISTQQNGKVPAANGQAAKEPQEDTVLEVLDDETEKENMLQDLASRRKTRQRELNKSLQGTVESPRDEEDTSARKMSMADAALSLTKTKSPSGLNTSVRERLKNKVKTVREKVESEAKEESRPARKLRALRERPPALTRFDKMNKEDLEAEKRLEESLSARSKWKKAGKGLKDALPTDEEAYDFFTHVYDAEEEEQEAPKPTRPPQPEAGPSGEGEEEEEGAREGEAEEEGETEPKGEGTAEETEVDRRREEAEKAQEALEDYLSEGWQMTHVHAAQYVGYQTRVDREKDIYFVPSMLPVPAEEKVPQDAQPRYLEDEGFYVGERPPVPFRNQNIAEDRLLKEPEDQGSKWFGEDGKIIALPDPLKTEPTRPPNMLLDEPEPMLETEYRKAWLKEFDGRYIDGSEQIPQHGRYQLDVDVNTLVFTHHSLFSREHVLSAKLNQLYQQYLVRTHKNMANFLTDKLKALKAAAKHLESQEGQGLNPPPTEQSGRLREYKNEIRQTRKLRDAEQQADRNLLKNILKVWRDIKSLRQLQAFTNTAVKLVVRKEETDKENDRVVWDQEVVEEVQEEEEAMEEEYRRQMNRYEALMVEWKKQHKARKQKKKKKKKKEGSQESLQDSLQEESIDHEEGELLPKPEAPQAPDREGLQEKVRQKALQIRRRPGEPILTPEVTNTATITPKQQCPRGEQLRRQDVERLQVFMKVLFNDKEVSRTRPRSLTSDFKVTFGEIFPILIIQWPESIKLQVFERGTLSNTLLAEVYSGIPEAAVTSGNVELEDLEFSSDQRVAFDHEAVGSGVMFSFEEDNSNPLCLLTTGIVSTSVSWGMGDDGTPLVPPVGPTTTTIHSPMLQADPVAAIGATGMVDMEKLANWIEESRLDPNDPSNAALMQHVKNFTGGKNGISRMPDYFRLEQLQEEFNFATDTELEKSKRFRLLKLRSREVPEFRSYPMVPLRDREIPDSIFKDYEKRQREKEEKDVRDDMDAHRKRVARFQSKVKEHVLNRYRMARHQFSLNDMVVEDQVPDIGTLTVTLLKITEPRRPLRPVRKERKKVTAQALSPGDVKILVNIQRAFNMQIRTGGGAGSDGGGGTSSGADRAAGDAHSAVLVRPFVEVTFQRTNQKTSTAEGINPSWNEELQLPLRVPNNDYSPGNLQTVDDTLFINVFDELVIDILEDDRQRGTDIHRRIERHWLGSIRIPFSTIYFQSQIDGTFRVEAPPVLLGYKRGGGGGSEGLDLQMGGNEHTYLTLFITIEPPLTPLEPLKEKFESQEDEKLLFQAEKWQAEIEKRFPKRNISTTVTDINGKSVFVTRFIQSLRPPDELIDSNADSKQNAERVARFVSLIPFISDSTLFAGICDIWSTCDQFLQMLSGDEEEHAVLLCNYFLHMGKKAWVLLGSAVPEGPTAYVLTHESNGDYLLWNPSSGEFFTQHNPFCPMQSVGCLINQDNIWANMQEYDGPMRMSFDTSKEAQWKPFFSRSYPNPGLSSIQPDQLVYLPTDKDYVAELQDRIERKLRDKVMEWRPHSITRWNRYCTQIFRRLLSRLEQSRGRGMADEHRAELEPVLASYKMSGFPMQMPYTEDNPVVEAVFSTGVHQLQGKDVEFALAVHIHPYPNSVLSVWVYVASLVRKR